MSDLEEIETNYNIRNNFKETENFASTSNDPSSNIKYSEDELDQILKKYGIDDQVKSYSHSDSSKVPSTSKVVEILSSDSEDDSSGTRISDISLTSSSGSSISQTKILQAVYSEPKRCYTFSSSSEDEAYVPLEKKLKDAEVNILKTLTNKYASFDTDDVIDKMFDKTDDADPLALKPSQKRKSPKQTELKKIEREKLKQQKLLEKEKKKEEEMRDKELKKLLQLQNKIVKPDQCLKFITVRIDPMFEKDSFYPEIIHAIRELGAIYQIEANKVNNAITWHRENQTHLIDNSGQLALSTTVEETSNVLIIFDWKELITKIHNDTIIPYVHNVMDIYPSKRITLGIYNLENYFRYWKINKIRGEKVKITHVAANANKYDKVYKDHPRISRKQVEAVLTELQLLFSCCARFVETPADVGLLVSNYTKATAQAPYKQEKQEKEVQLEKYLSGDNKDCVRVDKDGNGLQRLWKQQLSTLPHSSLEIAEAVVLAYPSLTKLMEAYETTNHGESLLQDLPIRRAAGPFSAIRKLGPEYSKKLYTYFTSIDEKVIVQT